MDYIYTKDPIEQAAKTAAKSIIDQLSSGKKVLWLLTGGSGLSIALYAMDTLKKHDLKKLTISLTDERYDYIGHEDENWQQLLDSGFKENGATIYRPLIGKNIQQTTAAFNNWIKKQLTINQYKIGLFGIGSDNHTAGIKPNSPAATSNDFVTSFIANDFERITITPRTIASLDEIIIQASGSDKKAAIQRLLTTDCDITTQPAQILKRVKKSSLFSDNKQEEL